MQNSSSSYFPRLLAILGVVALLAGLFVMLLLPAIKLAAWGVGALGIVLLLVSFVLGRREVGGALSSRRGRFSTGTTVMALIFIGIIIFVNMISINNYKRVDATGLAQFTLTTQTKDVLRALKTPIEARFFFGVGSEIDITLRSYAESLLNEYKNYTDKLTVEFIDTDAQPEQARQNGISTYSTAVFKSGNLRRVVYPWELVIMNDQGQVSAIDAEHAFTSAVLEVTGAVQKRVYFLTGHGEVGIDPNSIYSAVRNGLRDNLFQVGNLDLTLTPEIPADLAALVIASPQKPFTSAELDIVKRYLDDGGWVMFLFNPGSPQNVRDLLTPWGVKVEDGTVIDPTSFVSPNKDYPMVPRTRDEVFSLAEVYFPGATAITPQEKPPENLEIRPLVWTSKDSWLDKDFDPKKDPTFTEGVDLKGSQALGVLIAANVPKDQKEQSGFKGTRIIVFGDSDFARNQDFFNGNNGELFLKAVNLLTTGKELISIDRKVLPFRRMLVTQEQSNFITYSSITLLPLLVLLAGGVIWWRRR